VWLSRHRTAAELTRYSLAHVWFGRGAYGLAAAARTYFDKTPVDLSLSELALLFGLSQYPSRLDPSCAPERARAARNRVLGRLLAAAVITPAEHAAGVAQPLGARDLPCPP
jgi:penicillin-binding protein 1A